MLKFISLNESYFKKLTKVSNLFLLYLKQYLLLMSINFIIVALSYTYLEDISLFFFLFIIKFLIVLLASIYYDYVKFFTSFKYIELSFFNHRLTFIINILN